MLENSQNFWQRLSLPSPSPQLFTYLYRSLEPLRPATEIGKFLIRERPRTSACFRAKERLMRVTFGKKTNKHEETAAGLRENEENVKGGFGGLQTYLPAWEIIVSNSKLKENQLFVTEKNKQRKQKLTERVSWWPSSIKMRRWSQNPQNIVKAILMLTFSGRYSFFKDTFHWNGGSCQKDAIKLKHQLFSWRFLTKL